MKPGLIKNSFFICCLFFYLASPAQVLPVWTGFKDAEKVNDWLVKPDMLKAEVLKSADGRILFYIMVC